LGPTSVLTLDDVDLLCPLHMQRSMHGAILDALGGYEADAM
jgi:hypothetical protein